MMTYKLVALGEGGVGKTALTIQLCLQHFVETYDPTIEDSYRKQVVIDHESCMLEVLDTAGQEEYTVLRDQWIRDDDGYVLVYSTTSRSSFTRIHTLYRQIQRVKGSSGTDSLGPSVLGGGVGGGGKVPVILVGNKSDQTTEREVSSQEGSALAREWGCDFIETSAKKNINVDKAFYDMVRSIRRLQTFTDPPSGKSAVKAKKDRKTLSKGEKDSYTQHKKWPCVIFMRISPSVYKIFKKKGSYWTGADASDGIC